MRKKYSKKSTPKKPQVPLLQDAYDLTCHAVKAISAFIRATTITSAPDLQNLFSRLKKFSETVFNMSPSDLCVANIAKRIQKVIRDLCEKLSISFVLSEKSCEVLLTRLDSSINIPAFQLPSPSTLEIEPKILAEIKDELDDTMEEIKTELKDTKQSIIAQADENIFQNEVILVFGYSDTLIKFFSVFGLTRKGKKTESILKLS